MSKRLSLFRTPMSNGNVNIDPHERFQSLPNKAYHEKFLKTCVDEILKLAIFQGTSRSSKSSENLEKFSDLKFKEEYDTDEKLLELVRQVIRYPHSLNRLHAGIDPYGLIGQWLTDALSPSAHTSEDCPVFTILEEFVVKELRQIVGFKNGDGTFCAGSSLANGLGISCARLMHCPDIRCTGTSSMPRLVIFASTDAHQSIVKMAEFMGIGSDNVYSVETDGKGKLSIEHLESEIMRALNEGAKPFMVSANAGSTVLGAYDPFEKVADLCAKYKLWMHVDAIWGGGALMSPKHRYLLKGIERADSVTWNLDTLLAAPQECTAFLTKDCDILRKYHSNSTSLLHQDDKHIQFGRRADVFKFWFMWRAKGTKGLQQHIDKLFDNAEYLKEQIKNKDNFQLVLDNPECISVCFWYLPSNLLKHERNESFWQKLHQIAPQIKERSMKEGTMMLTYQPLGDKPNFFRMVILNSGLTKMEMKHILDEIDRLGNPL